MNGANQSLSEFVGFLGNPDMYGSMSHNAQFILVLSSLSLLMLFGVLMS